MVAELQTLPPLTPHNRALFLRYVQCTENLYALIDSLAKDPIPGSAANGQPTPDLADLYDWLASPSITPYITAHRTHSAHLIKCLALAALEELLTTTQDPIEKRRTASNIIRALNPRTPVRGFSDPRPRDTAGPTPNRAVVPPTSMPTTPPSAAPSPLGTRDSALNTSRPTPHPSPLQTEIARQVQAMLATADAEDDREDDDFDDEDDFNDEGDDDNNEDDPSPGGGGGATVLSGSREGASHTNSPPHPNSAPSPLGTRDSALSTSAFPQASLRFSGESPSPARSPP